MKYSLFSLNTHTDKVGYFFVVNNYVFLASTNPGDGETAFSRLEKHYFVVM